MGLWSAIFRYPWIGVPVLLLGCLFMVAIVSGLVHAIRLLAGELYRLIYRVPRGDLLCPVCGYDIRYTPHRCPECGTKLMWGLLPSARDLKRGNPRWR